MPITPAPTTTIEVGSDLRSRIPSESSTRSSSNSTPDGRAGLVPVAMTMYSPVMVVISRAARVFDGDGVRVDEAAVPDQQVDPVAHQLVAHHVDFLADDVLGSGQQVGRGDPILDAVARPVELALVMPVRYSTASRNVLDGIVPVLTQTPPSIRPRSMIATDLPSLADGDGGLLAARPRTDDDDVVLLHRTHGIDDKAHSQTFSTDAGLIAVARAPA